MLKILVSREKKGQAQSGRRQREALPDPPTSSIFANLLLFGPAWLGEKGKKKPGRNPPELTELARTRRGEERLKQRDRAALAARLFLYRGAFERV